MLVFQSWKGFKSKLVELNQVNLVALLFSSISAKADVLDACSWLKDNKPEAAFIALSNEVNWLQLLTWISSPSDLNQRVNNERQFVTSLGSCL